MDHKGKEIDTIFFVARDYTSDQEEFYEVQTEEVRKISPYFQHIATRPILVQDLVLFLGELLKKRSENIEPCKEESLPRNKDNGNSVKNSITENTQNESDCPDNSQHFTKVQEVKEEIALDIVKTEVKEEITENLIKEEKEDYPTDLDSINPQNDGHQRGSISMSQDNVSDPGNEEILPSMKHEASSRSITIGEHFETEEDEMSNRTSLIAPTETSIHQAQSVEKEIDRDAVISTGLPFEQNTEMSFNFSALTPPEGEKINLPAITEKDESSDESNDDEPDILRPICNANSVQKMNQTATGGLISALKPMDSYNDSIIKGKDNLVIHNSDGSNATGGSQMMDNHNRESMSPKAPLRPTGIEFTNIPGNEMKYTPLQLSEIEPLNMNHRYYEDHYKSSSNLGGKDMDQSDPTTEGSSGITMINRDTANMQNILGSSSFGNNETTTIPNVSNMEQMMRQKEAEEWLMGRSRKAESIPHALQQPFTDAALNTNTIDQHKGPESIPSNQMHLQIQQPSNQKLDPMFASAAFNQAPAQQNQFSNFQSIQHMQPQNKIQEGASASNDAIYYQGSGLFQCQTCKFSTNRRPRIKLHIKAVHKRIKDFICTLCEYSSSYRDHLKAHYLKHHRGYDGPIQKENTRSIGDGDVIIAHDPGPKPPVPSMDGNNKEALDNAPRYDSTGGINNNFNGGQLINHQINDSMNNNMSQMPLQINGQTQFQSNPESVRNNIMGMFPRFGSTNESSMQYPLAPIPYNPSQNPQLMSNNFQPNSMYNPNQSNSFIKQEVNDQQLPNGQYYQGMYPTGLDINNSNFPNLPPEHGQNHNFTDVPPEQQQWSNNQQKLPQESYDSQTKQFLCVECDYKTPQKTRLDLHIKAVHLKIRDNQCPHCEYKTAIKVALVSHITAIHEKLKKFECPHCEHKASQKVNLTKHIKGVHAQLKDFFCPKCEYKTSYKQQLGKHCMNVHRLAITTAGLLPNTQPQDNNIIDGDDRTENVYPPGFVPRQLQSSFMPPNNLEGNNMYVTPNSQNNNQQDMLSNSTESKVQSIQYETGNMATSQFMNNSYMNQTSAQEGASMNSMYDGIKKEQVSDLNSNNESPYFQSIGTVEELQPAFSS